MHSFPDGRMSTDIGAAGSVSALKNPVPVQLFSSQSNSQITVVQGDTDMLEQIEKLNGKWHKSNRWSLPDIVLVASPSDERTFLDTILWRFKENRSTAAIYTSIVWL